jgi:hypothetical protein
MKPVAVAATAWMLVFLCPQIVLAQTEVTRGSASIVAGGALLLAGDDIDSVYGFGPIIAGSIGGRYNPRAAVEAEVLVVGSVTSQYRYKGAYDITYQHNQFGVLVRVSLPASSFRNTEVNALVGFAVTYSRLISEFTVHQEFMNLGVAPSAGLEFTRWKNRTGFVLGSRAIFAAHTSAITPMLAMTAGLRTRF